MYIYIYIYTYVYIYVYICLMSKGVHASLLACISCGGENATLSIHRSQIGSLPILNKGQNPVSTSCRFGV